MSGLIKCGHCHANYIIIAKDTYGCATRRTKGTCANNHRLNRHQIERLVLHGIKEQLSAPHLVGEFIQAFNDEVRQINAGRTNDSRRTEAALRDTDKKLGAILAAIEQGVVTATTKDRLPELESEKAQLEGQIAQPGPAPYPSLHPNLAGLYRRKIDRLEEALNDPDIQQQAGEIIRSLVDHIEVNPNRPEDGSNGCGANWAPASDADPINADITLYGELSSVFAIAEETRGIENIGGFSRVAGVGFEPTTFRL